MQVRVRSPHKPFLQLGADNKPLNFAVVSIRQDKSAPSPKSPTQAGLTPDGYRLQAAPLFTVIQTAYVPLQGTLSFRPNQITGVPPWATYSPSTLYDIDAKVSEADLPNWRDPALQPAMLRAMLQAILADRFKLAIHRENRDVPVYELMLGSKPPKFKPAEATTPDRIRQKHPDVVTMRGGTLVVAGPNPGQQSLYGVTMQDLGTFLSTLAGRPIQDKTVLPGRYDITYTIELRPPPEEVTAAAPTPPQTSAAYGCCSRPSLPGRPHTPAVPRDAESAAQNPRQTETDTQRKSSAKGSFHYWSLPRRSPPEHTAAPETQGYRRPRVLQPGSP
jgi:uncharacterized protein (TIGR03435 family)